MTPWTYGLPDVRYRFRTAMMFSPVFTGALPPRLTMFTTKPSCRHSGIVMSTWEASAGRFRGEVKKNSIPVPADFANPSASFPRTNSISFPINHIRIFPYLLDLPQAAILSIHPSTPPKASFSLCAFRFPRVPSSLTIPSWNTTTIPTAVTHRATTWTATAPARATTTTLSTPRIFTGPLMISIGP